jgi:hypothetical protein
MVQLSPDHETMSHAKVRCSPRAISRSAAVTPVRTETSHHASQVDQHSSSGLQSREALSRKPWSCTTNPGRSGERQSRRRQGRARRRGIGRRRNRGRSTGRVRSRILPGQAGNDELCADSTLLVARNDLRGSLCPELHHKERCYRSSRLSQPRVAATKKSGTPLLSRYWLPLCLTENLQKSTRQRHLYRLSLI